MAVSDNYWVRVAVPAFHDTRKWLPGTRDRMLVRRHALKLKYWPEKSPAVDSGQVVDVDWCWVKALKDLKIGELRIDDTIGGHDNLRVIFYRHDKIHADDPLPIIWVLTVMQKKRDDFTTNELKTFRGRRLLVLARYYGPGCL